MKQLYDFSYGRVLQRTGTTIMDAAPDGSITTFAQIDATTLPGPRPGGVGLTTALTVLHPSGAHHGQCRAQASPTRTRHWACCPPDGSSWGVLERSTIRSITRPRARLGGASWTT